MPVEAVAVLKKFVDLPTTNDRKAEAWFTLAEIQRGLNLPEAAVSYKHCVAFNNPNFHSRALLELAGLAIAQQNLDEAQALLVSIKMAPPFPDRASHQTALIKLANLYFQRKQFEKAALECKEIINQYANENQYVVREQLGECYLKIAWQAFENFSGAQDEITAPKKQHYMKEWQSHLDLARVVFQEIAEELDAKAQDWQLPPNGRPLPPQEERLRRDAHFKVVDCCLELQGSLHDAFLRSHRLYEQFREDREGLWACQRLCQCLTKALATNRDDIALYIEAADDAVQYCLNHLDKYDAVGAFRSLDERERFNDWLKNMHSYLNSIKRRGG
jgi:hypothetical protein